MMPFLSAVCLSVTGSSHERHHPPLPRLPPPSAGFQIAQLTRRWWRAKCSHCGKWIPEPIWDISVFKKLLDVDVSIRFGHIQIHLFACVKIKQMQNKSVVGPHVAIAWISHPPLHLSWCAAAFFPFYFLHEFRNKSSPPMDVTLLSLHSYKPLTLPSCLPWSTRTDIECHKSVS